MGLKSKCSIYDKISFLNPRFEGSRKSKESEDSQIKLKDKADLYVGTESGDSCEKSAFVWKRCNGVQCTKAISSNRLKIFL